MKQKTRGKGRPKNDEQSERAYIRFPAEELDQHKREARTMGLSLSAYLRLRVNGIVKAQEQPK